MSFEELLLNRKISANSLSKLSGIPITTILDLEKGRSELRKASGLTLYKLAKALNVSMESLIELNCPSDIDAKTGRPLDKGYFECSVNPQMKNIIRNLKNAVCANNELKKNYWKDLLIEEMTSARRQELISDECCSYMYNKYIGGNE